MLDNDERSSLFGLFFMDEVKKFCENLHQDCNMGACQGVSIF